MAVCYHFGKNGLPVQEPGVENAFHDLPTAPSASRGVIMTNTIKSGGLRLVAALLTGAVLFVMCEGVCQAQRSLLETPLPELVPGGTKNRALDTCDFNQHQVDHTTYTFKTALTFQVQVTASPTAPSVTGTVTVSQVPASSTTTRPCTDTKWPLRSINEVNQNVYNKLHPSNPPAPSQQCLAPAAQPPSALTPAPPAVSRAPVPATT